MRIQRGGGGLGGPDPPWKITEKITINCDSN